MRSVTPVLAAAGLAVLTACGGSDAETSTAAPTTNTAAATTATTTADPGTSTAAAASGGGEVTAQAAARPRTIATGLNTPWSIAFLPSGDALVSERGGVIKRVAAKTRRVTTEMRVPGVVEQGESGLLGLAVSPTYAKDRMVYAYLTTARDNRIVRFRLRGKPRVVVSGLEKAPIHDGGRIAFGPDGKLYAGVGDAGNTDLAQDQDSQNGKILRMNPSGSVPKDNPFPGSRVFSLGHRNVQGLAFDAKGRLWASEFGQSTRDEVNLVEKGKNYGWPTVEGRGDTQGGKFTNPLVTWATSEASPSGVAIVGTHLYVAALGGERLWDVPLRGAKTGRPKALLQGRYGRIRAATAAPDGSLWIATSNRDGRGDVRSGDDRILRLAVKR
ncbi:PQQ-dependent sugar dehydrogenase [Patulibacter americanus]|uniref:PQQ-dependent sugar dehydrogenase n=1 Tax=Patulibacter americanus TaxID=588672 RepID=UPI0003B63946|nr:PQQ-dependent sugar dehydrogenase [Patulibacter americanus]